MLAWRQVGLDWTWWMNFELRNQGFSENRMKIHPSGYVFLALHGFRLNLMDEFKGWKSWFYKNSSIRLCLRGGNWLWTEPDGWILNLEIRASLRTVWKFIHQVTFFWRCMGLDWTSWMNLKVGNHDLFKNIHQNSSIRLCLRGGKWVWTEPDGWILNLEIRASLRTVWKFIHQVTFFWRCMGLDWTSWMNLKVGNHDFTKIHPSGYVCVAAIGSGLNLMDEFWT